MVLYFEDVELEKKWCENIMKVLFIFMIILICIYLQCYVYISMIKPVVLANICLSKLLKRFQVVGQAKNTAKKTTCFYADVRLCQTKCSF